MSLSIQTILFPPKKEPSMATINKRPFRVSTKLKPVASSIPTEDPVDVHKLESILNSVSVQSDELLLGEEMWRKRAQQKHLSDSCLTSVGRSKSVATTFPTIQQARDWSVEKEFWLSYIPLKKHIWAYTVGGRTCELWNPVRGDEQILKELQTDARTGAQIPFSQKCERYHKQLTWEHKVVSDYDQRMLGKFPIIGPKRSAKYGREKDIAQTQTQNRFKSYRKAVMDNLVDVQVETKLMDEYRVRGFTRRFQVEQMERLIEGYINLKWVYDLNPELVESLAEQHLKGPGGKRWMNLSRVEVKKVLKLLTNSKEDPNFCPYSSLMPQSAVSHAEKPFSQPTVPSQQPPCSGRSTLSQKLECKKNKRKGTRPLKPSQLMPLHVPGPDSLHQNVLIRAYTPEIDDAQGNLATSSSALLNTANTTQAENGIPTDNVDNLPEEEGLTIESFSPFYKS